MTRSGPSVRVRSLGRLAAIPPDERARWLERMRSLWAAGLAEHLPAGSDWPDRLWDSVADWYAEVGIAQIAEVDDDLVGFQLVSDRRAGAVRYTVLHATAVRADLQGANIAFALTTRTLLASLWRARTLRMYLTSRVFSPLALAGVYGVTPDRRSFSPSIDPTIRPAESVTAATHLYVRTFYPAYEWDETTSLIAGGGEEPAPRFRVRSGTPLIDRFWDDHLHDGGASVLCVQEVSPRIFTSAIPLIVRALGRTVRIRLGARRRHVPVPADEPEEAR